MDQNQLQGEAVNVSKEPDRFRLVFALQALVRQLLENQIELVRPCRTACLLMLSGLAPNSIPRELGNRVVDEQHEDGGWVGPDDTMWALLFLKLTGLSATEHFRKGLVFLHNQRANEFGWGRSMRDIPRIPVTGRLLYFLPEVHCNNYTDGLLRLWDKEKNSLTYKAAFTLAAARTAQIQSERNTIIADAIAWLAEQQNSDGGFSPWRGHPVGSDIYCTAIALVGLLQYPNKDHTKMLSSALQWMASTQLGNGLWAYHQIEDGAAWGLYASYLAQETLPNC